MFGLSPGHLLVILLIVVLVFGTKKLRNLGSDLGGAIKGFKEGMSGTEEAPKQVSQSTAQTIDAEVKDKTNTNI